MLETALIVGTVAACFLILVAVVNHRVGQYLNPPLREEIEELKADQKLVGFELDKLNDRVNDIVVNKGMRL